MMTKFRIDDRLPCILGHEVSEAPDDSKKWHLKVTAVQANSLKLGYFPVEEKRFILGRGTKEEMEALWIYINEEIRIATRS